MNFKLISMSESYHCDKSEIHKLEKFENRRYGHTSVWIFVGMAGNYCSRWGGECNTALVYR